MDSRFDRVALDKHEVAERFGQVARAFDALVQRIGGIDVPDRRVARVVWWIVRRFSGIADRDEREKQGGRQKKCG